MTPKEQAHEEVIEVIGFMLGEGLNPMTSVSLADVRNLMELAWMRGYSAAEENKEST